MKRKIGILASLIVATFFSHTSHARQLAGIPWTDFVKKSEMVFRGVLVRAQVVDWEKQVGGPSEDIQYTYRVFEVYKGEEVKDVTFTAPAEEQINKTVGRLAIIALRKDGKEWTLSVDERSCWTYHNEMKKDFGGLGVYDMTPALLQDMPAEFRETAEVQVRYGDDLKVESKNLFTSAAVEKHLKAALAAVK